LHQNRTEGFTYSAFILAAQNGHTEIVDWLYNNVANKYIGKAFF